MPRWSLRQLPQQNRRRKMSSFQMERLKRNTWCDSVTDENWKGWIKLRQPVSLLTVNTPPEDGTVLRVDCFHTFSMLTNYNCPTSSVMVKAGVSTFRNHFCKLCHFVMGPRSTVHYWRVRFTPCSSFCRRDFMRTNEKRLLNSYLVSFRPKRGLGHNLCCSLS